LLESVQALFLSREDIRGQEARVIEWFQRMPVGVLTADRDGALLFVNGERYEVHPRPAREVDPTGAGDVFGTALLIEYEREGNHWDAAAAAACAAAMSVEAPGAAGTPDRAALDARLRAYRRRQVGG
jgi:sugar/nucleoside kinase (ribokinase family)